MSATPRDPSWYIDHPEVIVVTTKKVSCDGGGGALGHPKVWYDMSEDEWVECKYCDRVYVLKGGSHDPHG
ncbi:MAG: zinc-finger domain-containing protein [Alphaproteobacteria bacterium]|nr:zinc-finger domain-containing protein [Alphaproteobacteria bacterium]